MESRSSPPPVNTPRAALFDFDGTISTLRAGWEAVMRGLMLDVLAEADIGRGALERAVDLYIDESTGIQTIEQMEWLVGAHEQYLGRAPSLDAWAYKREYTTRLKRSIRDRTAAVERREVDPELYMVRGAAAFLRALREQGVALFLASGTDHPDVLREAGILQVAEHFADIQGAPPDRADWSKGEVINRLLREKGIRGRELLVVGDGKVEIALGVRHGARTLGVASDERRAGGCDLAKQRRLHAVGADAVVADFGDVDRLMAWAGFKQ